MVTVYSFSLDDIDLSFPYNNNSSFVSQIFFIPNLKHLHTLKLLTGLNMRFKFWGFVAYPESLDYRLGCRIFQIIAFNKEQLKLPTNF